ncbi:conserved hypothetical tiny transmembrane protein [Paenibacillus sp. yr247]|nr:hypothetical protein [Paenibacillus sp. yr247]SDN51782.1 conserved hypothetical tiny transmembrane protein [Paenibacillus sp. yr247]
MAQPITSSAAILVLFILLVIISMAFCMVNFVNYVKLAPGVALLGALFL